MTSAERFRLLHQFLTRNRKVMSRTASPPTFESLIRAYEKDLHFPQNMKDTFGVMLAVSLSSEVPADPLWLHVVGPPSSGKSTLCEAIGHDVDHTILLSKLTGLLSGCDPEEGRRKKRKDDDDDDATPEDLSPLIRFLGKTLIIKDFTTIMQMGDATLNNLFGEFRDAYDGRISASYRNKIGNKDYSNVRFSIITGVTDAIHLLDNTDLGERFLKVEIQDKDDAIDEDMLLEKSINNTINSMGTAAGETSSHNIVMHRLREKTAQFLCHHRKSVESLLPKVKTTEEFKKSVSCIARLCAIVRTKVHRERGGGDIIIRPRAENPARLAGQLTKLGGMLAFTQGKNKTDEEVIRIVRKVGFDTCRGYPLDVVMALHTSREPLTSVEVADKVGISPASAYRRLCDLHELDAVSKVKIQLNDSRGRRAAAYMLTDKVRSYCDQSICRPVRSRIDPRKRRLSTTGGRKG